RETARTPHMFGGMTQKGARARTRRSQRLLMGPWSHAVNAHSKLGEVDFGSSAIIDLDGYQLRWFDHWLRGTDTGLLDEQSVRVFLMGANRWMDASAWPPPEAQPTPFYLHSGGHANSRFGDGGL